MSGVLHTHPRLVLDHAFAVETNSAALRDHLDAVFCGLPDADGQAAVYRCTVAGDEHDPTVTVEAAERTVAVDAHPARAVSLLVRHVNATGLNAARDCVVVHAGAVARHGRAILLPGRSGAGKTTLVAALLRAGFQYLSDEAAVLRPDGRIWPYAKPLSISRGAQPLFAELRPEHPALPGLGEGGDWQVPAHRIGGADVWAGPATPAAVVAFAYEPGLPARLAPLSRARALIAMMESGIFPGPSGRSALERLRALTADCATWTLTHADAHEAAAVLDRAHTAEAAR
jgi:hypothetical protein